MKFIRYINEEIDYTEKYKELLDLLLKDVKPSFFQEIRKAGRFLYRATKLALPEGQFYTKKDKKVGERKPKDTELEQHRFYNRKFMEAFGWEARNGIFVSGSYLPLYGNSFLFFPIGPYKFLWSPKVEDFTDYISLLPEWEDLDIKSLYTDKNLTGAIKSDNEIIFNCKKFYLIDADRHFSPGVWNLISFLREHLL